MSSKDVPSKLHFRHAIKKMASFIPCLKIAKWQEISAKINRQQPEIGLNPNILAYFNSP